MTMNTHAQTNAVKRVLVLMLASGAFALSACGSDSKSPEVASAVEDPGYRGGTIYVRPAYPDAPDVQQPHDGESVRAPRAMGGEPTGPTV